jgi:hypothetical protein
MPGKSRHGKGKHPHYSKKSKIRQRQVSEGTPQQAGAGMPQPATASIPKPAAPAAAPPRPKTSVGPATAVTAPYTDIVGELKRIGILTGIIIIILIVLSIVLS